MSWIKIDSTLAEKPQVRKMARLLKLDRWAVAGRLVALWGWCDEHTTDGKTSLIEEEVDELCGKKGFSRAMEAVGWLVNAGEGELAIANFDKHNGATGKKRAQDAVRQFSKRVRDNEKVTQEHEKSHAEVEKKSRGERDEKAILSDQEKEKEYNKKEVGKATLHREQPAAASPAPQASSSSVLPEGFLPWLGALGQAHPSLRQSAKLHPTVQSAALAAYERCPKASEKAALLTAFLGDRLREDSHGFRFYRPSGQERFFEKLEDTIASAEKWDKETSWSKKQARLVKMPRESREDCAQRVFSDKVGVDSQNESKAILEGIKRDLGIGGKNGK